MKHELNPHEPSDVHGITLGNSYVAVSFNRIRRCFTLGHTDSPEEAFKIRELWLKDHPEYGFSPRHGT